MSWTPDFWIKESDFIKLKDYILNLGNLDSAQSWKFKIAGQNGVVIHAGESSSTNREIHDIIKNIPHWLLNSEGEICENCYGWGDEIDEYTYL